MWRQQKEQIHEASLTFEGVTFSGVFVELVRL